MAHGLEQQKAAVQSGYWPLFRYNPALAAQGKNPFQLDSQARRRMPLEKYIYNETRYTMLVQSNPEAAAQLLALAQEDVRDALEAVRAHGGACQRRRRVNGSAGDRPKGGHAMIDLTTTYLGLKLKNPLVVLVLAAVRGPRRNIRRMEDAGRRRRRAALAVRGADHARERRPRPLPRPRHRVATPRRCRYFPDMADYNLGPEGYLEHIRKAKQALGDPGHRQPERRIARRLGALRHGRSSRPAPTRWS